MKWLKKIIKRNKIVFPEKKNYSNDEQLMIDHAKTILVYQNGSLKNL